MKIFVAGLDCAAPELVFRLPIEGMPLLDIAPTLLELSGHPVPETMQGQSLLSRASYTGSR